MTMKTSSSLSKRGFTLVEMLVSVTVLGLIMAMVGQIVSSASQAISNSGKDLNCDDQARLIFGRMDSDFARMLKRSDVDVIFAKQSGTGGNGGNDAIYFVTQDAGSNSNSWYTSNPTTSPNLLTLAGYCIAPDSSGATINPTVSSPLNDLMRLGHALTWDNGNSSVDNLVFVSFAAPSGSTSTLITTTTLDGHWGSTTIGASPTYTPPTGGSNYGDYHSLGDQVFRFEYCFLLKDGTYSNVPVMTSNGLRYNTAGSGPPTPINDNSDTATGSAGTSSTNYGAGSRWFDSTNGRAFICVNPAKSNAVWAPLGTQDISAVVVGIALLDRNSRKSITTASIYNNLPGFFADSLQTTTSTGVSLSANPTTTSPILMQQNWQTTIDHAGFAAAANLPASAAGHIRIFQRYFYLNANNL